MGIWQMLPGEVARHIDEKEFTQLTTLQGLIIQPGVTAIIFIDGTFAGSVSAGSYNFVSDSSINALMHANAPLHDAGFLTKAKKFIIKLFTGSKSENINPKPESENQTRSKAVEKLLRGNNISVYIINSAVFSAIFGSSQDANGRSGFIPMYVNTLTGPINMAVSLNLRIVDDEEFIVHYMHNRKTLQLAQLQEMIMPYLARVMRNVFSNVAIDERGIPENAIKTVEQQLHDLRMQLGSMEIVSVIDISCDSEVFERYRSIAAKLYNTEKELDFYIRSNDFKNRLTAEENRQKIAEARSEHELKIALDEINKDRILKEEELARFYRVLSRQRRIAEANDASEIGKSLREIEKADIYSADELEAVKATVYARNRIRLIELGSTVLRSENEADKLRISLNREIQHMNHADRMTTLQNDIEYGNTKRAYDRQDEIDDAVHTRTLNNIGIETNSDTDKYNDWRWNVGRTQANTAALDEIEINKTRGMSEIEIDKARMKGVTENLSQKVDMAIKLQNSMTENKLREQNLHLSHEQSMAEIARASRHDELVNLKDYTPEQLAATKLDAAGAAEALSSRKEAEILRLAEERRREDERIRIEREDALRKEQSNEYRHLFDQMMGTVNNMIASNNHNGTVDKIIDLAKHRANEQSATASARAEEYRTEMHRTQDRLDATQDSSLNYVTRNNVGQSRQIIVRCTCGREEMISPSATEVFCKSCGRELTID